MRALARQDPGLPEPGAQHGSASSVARRLASVGRHKRGWVALGLIILLGAGGALSYLQVHDLLSTVTARFQSAQAHMNRGKDELKQANQKHDLKLIDEARYQFRVAIDDFRMARQAADGNRLAHTAGLLPSGGYVQSRLQAVDDLAEVGTSIGQAALRGADVDQLLLTPSEGMPQKGTARLLAVMHSAQPVVAVARSDMQRAARAATRIDPAVLPASERPALASIKQTISKGLAGLDEFDRLIPVLDEVLGANGPKTYLVEQANTFELRAGGGYIGTYSLITADQGQLKVLQGGDTHELPDFNAREGQPKYVSPPPAMLEFLKNQSWSLGDSNFFPDFESNARAAIDFSQRDFPGHKVDGVISLDLDAVSAMLELTGPIQLPGTNTRLDAANLAATLILLDIQDPQHKQKVGSLAGLLMQKVTALGADQWPQLLDILNQQVSQRHLQVYFSDQGAEAEVQRLGWAGNLSWYGNTDFVYPVESNFGGNKANFFLSRQYTIDLSRNRAGIHHRVQEDLTLDLSRAPAAVREKVPSYRAYFRLFVPSSATDTQIRNSKPSDRSYTGVPSGTRVIEGWQQVNTNAHTSIGSLQIVFEYDTPLTAGDSGQHLLYWQKQPGTQADKFTLHWNDGSTTTTTTGDFRWDRLFVLSPGKIEVRTGKTAQAQLPKLSL